MIPVIISDTSLAAKTAAEKKRSEISMVLSIKTTSIHDNDQQQTTENVSGEREYDIENGDTVLLPGAGKQASLQKANGTGGFEPTRGQRQQAEQAIAAPPSVRSLANSIEQKTGRTASVPSSAVPKPAGSFTIRAGSGPPQVSPVRIAQKGGAAAAGEVDRPSQERHKRVLTTLEVKQPPPHRPQVEKHYICNSVKI